MRRAAASSGARMKRTVSSLSLSIRTAAALADVTTRTALTHRPIRHAAAAAALVHTAARIRSAAPIHPRRHSRPAERSLPVVVRSVTIARLVLLMFDNHTHILNAHVLRVNQLLSRLRRIEHHERVRHRSEYGLFPYSHVDHVRVTAA